MNPISKRILSILLVAVMCLTMLPGTAFAAEGDPCKMSGCTGTYTAAGYCNVCSWPEKGDSCAHDLISQGDGYVCTKCEKYFDTCPHLAWDMIKKRCATCGTCGHVFRDEYPTFTIYTSNDSYTHNVIVRCIGCGETVSSPKEDHTILSHATCLKKAVCEQCGEFGSENKANHVNPTPTCTESAANNFVHEIRYECCGTVVTTEEHTDGDGDLACDACGSTNFHEHSFVYTYITKKPSLVEMRKSHLVIKSCTGCDTTFDETAESCSGSTTCKGQICLKCGAIYGEATDPDNHADTNITYTDNGNGTHTGKYACCGTVVTTEEHTDGDGDLACDACGSTNFHKHSFVYTYRQGDTLVMIARKQHYVDKSCTECDDTFARTTEACSVSTTCKGQICLKCGASYGEATDPNNHADTNITYTDNGDGTHTGKYACCGAEYETVAHDENCDICTNFHEHSFVYTYQVNRPTLGGTAKRHNVNKSCTDCDATFPRTTEACEFDINCLGGKCTKCGNTTTDKNPDNHADTNITYTDNGDGTHTGKYACCGAEYETVAHDENCDICTNFHEHNFEYTYRQGDTLVMIVRKQHYVDKSCTECDDTFARTTEACSVFTTCIGQVCLKCGYKYSNTTNPDNHADTNITYTDNGDGTHNGTYACCGAAYVTNESHSYGDDNTCVCGAVAETISAAITWGAMSFTYTDGEWDPETHTYGEGKWTPDDENGNVITVKNNSNVTVNVTFTYTETVTEVEGSFTDESGSAIPSPFALAPEEEKKIKLILNRKPSSTFEDKELGTVTVSITLPDKQDP